jgi:hypothetical protein
VDVLSKTKNRDEFDGEIFAKLVDTIIVKGRDNIVFVLKDGREVK